MRTRALGLILAVLVLGCSKKDETSLKEKPARS